MKIKTSIMALTAMLTLLFGTSPESLSAKASGKKYRKQSLTLPLK
jgi:hypothetical protein